MPTITAAGLALTGVRGLSFDAADTLFHSRSSWQRIRPSFQRHGLSSAAWSAAVAATGADGLWPEDSRTQPERLARWADFYRSCLARTPVGTGGAAGELAELAATVTTDPHSYDSFADVTACLQRLTDAGIPMVITSNFDCLLYDILDRLELRRWFVAVVCSFEVGAYKPAPAMFRATARAAGLPATAMAHIGDAPMSDAGGARSAGLLPIVLDRDRTLVASALTISSLDALGLG